ncbi:hypothetical protein [Neobacillus piezotolerans]|uniref:hypothetical protein n=1 Tax=Neobacillus piezotolerans TaxID=2259171 RepID=UPI003F6E3AE7
MAWHKFQEGDDSNGHKHRNRRRYFWLCGLGANQVHQPLEKREMRSLLNSGFLCRRMRAFKKIAAASFCHAGFIHEWVKTAVFRQQFLISKNCRF